jgi:peptidylprolyl isomerase
VDTGSPTTIGCQLRHLSTIGHKSLASSVRLRILTGVSVPFGSKEAILATAKIGDKVRVHYTGKLADNTIFDSTVERGPMELVLGQNSTTIGFEEGIVGMEVGQRKTFAVPSMKGFGPRSRNLMLQISKSDIPPHIAPKLGQRLQIPQKDGKVAQVTVTRIGDTRIEVDGNHPLAGKTLTFEVELLAIVQP